jgi:hypothetical protein
MNSKFKNLFVLIGTITLILSLSLVSVFAADSAEMSNLTDIASKEMKVGDTIHVGDGYLTKIADESNETNISIFDQSDIALYDPSPAGGILSIASRLGYQSTDSVSTLGASAVSINPVLTLNAYISLSLYAALPDLDYTHWRTEAKFTYPSNALSATFTINGTNMGTANITGGGTYIYTYWIPRTQSYTYMRVDCTTPTHTYWLGSGYVYFYPQQS